MSYSKRQFVEEAFNEIGLASYIYTLTPDQLQFCLKRLDGMMGTWNGLGIRVGYPIPSSPEDSDLDDATNVADNANEAIYLNLAKKIAPSFGKTLSNDTKTNARESYNELIMHHTRPPKQNFPTTLPLGAGNKSWRYNNNPYVRPPEQEIDAGTDNEIEFD